MATTVVDPDNGAGADYTNIIDWESTQQGVLSAPEIAKCRCTGGTADYEASDYLSIAGWTTTAANYIKIWTDPAESYRHEGVWSTGNKYRYQSDYNGSGNAGIEVSEAYVRIEGIQILRDIGDQNEGAIICRDSANEGSFYLSHCLIVGGGTTSENYHNAWNSYSEGTGKTHYIYNNIFIDWIASGTGCGPISIWDTTTTYVIYNNTMDNFENGVFMGDAVTAHIKNNIFSNVGLYGVNPSGGDPSATSGYNITEDGTLSTNYHIWGSTHATGNVTSTSSGKLIDSGGGLSSVQVNSIVQNDIQNTMSYVTAVDSDTQLTLNDHIFISGTDAYEVYTNMWSDAVVFENEGNDEFLLGSSDTVAKDKGLDLSEDVILEITDDILGTSRPQ